MDPQFLIKGLILGFSIAVPVGPIGVLCIRRTLQYGRFSGFFSGLGAAAADTIYGVIAALGLSFVSDFLLDCELWLRLIGGVILILLGVKTFFAKTLQQSGKVMHKTLISDFISTFFLTMTNPMTILAYVAIFAGFGLTGIKGHHLDATALIVGVFIGSACWWLILSQGVSFFRKRVDAYVMHWINRIAGLIIIFFGLTVWVSILHFKAVCTT
ncbi:MAG: LysE family transporter [Chlamydiota bacterium]